MRLSPLLRADLIGRGQGISQRYGDPQGCKEKYPEEEGKTA